MTPRVYIPNGRCTESLHYTHHCTSNMASQDSVNSTPVQAEPQARSRTKEITLASGGRPIDTPLPLSFPSILRNPGISDRFAHLRVQPSKTPAPIFSKKLKNRTDENGGKRWVRRKDNGSFLSCQIYCIFSDVDDVYQLASSEIPMSLQRRRRIILSNLPSLEQPSLNPSPLI